MNVLQADENDVHAEFRLVRARLDAAADFLGCLEAVIGHDAVHVHVHQVTDDFAVGQFLQQLVRVDVMVGPVHQVGDLILKRNADGEDIGRNRLFVFIGLHCLTAAGHEHPRGFGAFTFAALEVRLGPQHGPFLGHVRVRHLAHDETSNLPGLIAINLVDGPGPFEMQSRFQRRACTTLPAEVFQQSLLVRVDDDEGR